MKNDKAFYDSLIGRFAKTKILVVGDLMVDRFIRGKVSRISPEAPVPVVLVREENNVPGGAGNVMMNMAALGAGVSCCGVLGDDAAGERLLEHLQSFGVDTQEIQKDPSRQTTVKTRVIAEHQQVVRFDQENSAPFSPSVQSALLNSIARLVRESDAVVLSDYGKGVIAKPLLTETIRQCRRLGKPVCVDPKLEHFLSYQGVTCITPNLNEAVGGMRRVKLKNKQDLLQLGKDILKRLKCESVLITRGEEGMSLFEKNRITTIPAKAREVYDVTGAGDTVISVLTLALACGATLVQSATIANLAASIVVGKLGTATVSPQELRQALKLL